MLIKKLSSKKYLILILLLQILFIYIHIYKENLFVASLYQQQKLEQKMAILEGEYSQLLLRMETLKQRSSIQKFAENDLQLHKVSLSAIKTLP